MKSPAALDSFLRTTAVLSLLAVFASCATAPVGSQASWQPNRKTRGPATPFWHQFPPKAEGFFLIPNQTLAESTPVALLGTRRGFTRVQLQSLEIGWVPRGTLRNN